MFQQESEMILLRFYIVVFNIVYTLYFFYIFSMPFDYVVDFVKRRWEMNFDSNLICEQCCTLPPR